MLKNKKFNVLIYRLSKDEISIEKKIFGDQFKIHALESKDLNNTDSKILNSVHGILAWHEATYDRKVISKLKNCKIIVRVGVGFDNVDLNFARKKNIIVCTVPDYGVDDVADHAITLLLYFIKKIGFYNDNFRYNDKWSWGDLSSIKRIKGFKLGILGFGRIGSATAIRAKSFGMDVSFYDPYIPVGTEKVFNVKRHHSLDNFLSELDALSIHTPLNSETNELVEKKFIRKIKKKAILINTARGGIVNSIDVHNALKDNHLYAFGSDVFDQEPPPLSNPLIMAWKSETSWLNNRIIITPHCAPFNKESYRELREKAAKEVKNFLLHGKYLSKVN